MRRAICLLTAAAMALQATGIAFASYTYDDAGRTETIDKFGETTTFEYDEASRPEKMTYDTGAYALYTYDGRSRIKAVEHKNSSNTLLRKETNVYDPASRITSRYEGPASGGVTTTFTYDDVGQLTGESSSGYSASYTYDANGNRTNRTVNGVSETYTVDDSDKLTSVTWSSGGNNYAKEYAYHYSGRPTSITLKTNGVTTATRTFTWDKESRITALTDGTTSASYAYNGFTARTSKTVGGTSTTYKRAGASAVSPVVANTTGGTTTNHLPGISSKTGGTSTFSHCGIKNGVLQTNSSQSNTGTKRYDAFGNVLNATGSWATQFSYGAPFGYQSDSEFGYQLLGHRYYDSSTGRFLTRDPVEAGRNWYAYALNNPVSNIDPTGLITDSERMADVFVGYWEAIKGIVTAPADIYNYLSENGVSGESLSKLGNGMVQGFVDGITSTDGRKFGETLGGVLLMAVPSGGIVGKLGKAARAAKAASRASRVRETVGLIEEWLGPGATAKKSSTSDLVLVSADESKVIHFDITNPKPHANPHVDILEKGKKPVKVYPWDVEPH